MANADQQDNKDRRGTLKRCINLDWLECSCLESYNNYPHDADYFRRLGFNVDERPYGTRVFAEMFTLCDQYGNPIIEVRRAPLAEKKDGSRAFLEPMLCLLRLHNRACYFDSAATIMQNFIKEHGFVFQRIKRVDICLDFERFDSGDDPGKFIQRYIKGKYSKVNQSRINAHGEDLWERREWNSVSWGSKSSMVSTKLYNKTTEIREVKDKPYIREAWALSGLVDDFITLQKRDKTGNLYFPSIWRLEFSLQSSVRNWVVFEDCNGDRKRLRSVRNTLELYKSRADLLTMFANLSAHYFHFKHYEAGKRKDRCQDKQLFKFDSPSEYYTIEQPAAAHAAPSRLVMLLKRLREYRAICFEPDTIKAVDSLLSLLDDKELRLQLSNPYSDSELALLRTLVAYRVNQKPNEDVQTSIQHVKRLLSLEQDIF